MFNETLSRVVDEAAGEIRVAIRQNTDVLIACQKGRALAERLRMPGNDQVVIVIVISEVAHNIIRYAGRGEIVLSIIKQDGRSGILVMARDEGPGIPDLEWALRDGYSTGQGLGLGLSGARRLVDEFDIVSRPGKGTVVRMKKWKRNEYRS